MSVTHWLIVALIVVVVFGAKKLPQLGKGLGEGMRNFKKGINGEGDIDVEGSTNYSYSGIIGAPLEMKRHSFRILIVFFLF
jgi:TatA/E family protein of Tat protein translocase